MTAKTTKNKSPDLRIAAGSTEPEPIGIIDPKTPLGTRLLWDEQPHLADDMGFVWLTFVGFNGGRVKLARHDQKGYVREDGDPAAPLISAEYWNAECAAHVHDMWPPTDEFDIGGVTDRRLRRLNQIAAIAAAAV